MNWTGGRLTRGVRKADNSVINKQKQHFAKVRNTLLHGAKKSPAQWSIFDQITINVKRGSSERGDNTPIRHGERSPSRYHRQRSPSHHHDSRKHGREAEEPEYRKQTNRRRLSPLVQKDTHDTVKIKKEAYEASAHKLRKADVTDVDDEMEVLRRRKLKLLRDSDWLGLGLQEPIKLKYAPTGLDDNIGRRRRLKPGHEARYEKSHVRLSPAHHRNCDTRSEVRVTIDGKGRRVGVSSSAAPSRGTAPPISMHSQSSDVMLLDQRLESEAPQMEHAEDDRRRRRPSHSERDNRNERHATQQVITRHGEEKIPPWEDLGRLSEEAGRQPRLNDNQPSFSSSSIRRMAEARGLAVPEDNEAFKSLLSSSQHASSQVLPALPPPPKQATQQNDNAIARKNGRLIMPSSPPVLHHPVPRRATSQILRTNPLDIASSAAATVGEVPKLTKAEEEGEKMWKDWLGEDAADGSDAGPRPDEEDREESRARSITPGISQYVPRRVGSQSPQSSPQRETARESAGSSPSARGSDGSIAHNMMRFSSSVNSTTLSAARTPSTHIQAMESHVTVYLMAPSPGGGSLTTARRQAENLVTVAGCQSYPES